MGLIRVNPDDLQRAASEIEHVAEAYRGLADQALRVAQRAPSYDGQFGPQVLPVGDEANGRLNGLAVRLSEFSQKLVQLAEAFEAADAQAVGGLLALASSLQTLLGSDLSGLTLSLLRPSHISEAVWKALPLEDRLAILEGLGLYSSVGAGPAAGTVLNVLNPLRVRLEPGLNGEIGAYATPGSEVIYSGRSQTIEGVEWYQVKYDDPLHGLITGWVCSYYLSTGRSRAGFDPKDVPQLFDMHTNLEVQESGGRLMSVTAVEYLQIRDGPTGDYAVVDAPEWGRVVRWTGNYIEEGDHTWYEVTHWMETDDEGQLEAVSGWVRGDRVVDYVPPADVPAPEGTIMVPLKEERSFSYYTVTDVDSYVPTSADPQHFEDSYQVRWANDIGRDLEVPYGSVFGGDGVAMQGSGRVTIPVFDPVTGDQLIDPVTGDPVTEVQYFELDNGTELDWVNEGGDSTTWEPGGWTRGSPAEIANPEDARFRPVSKAPDLISGVSVAGPRELRGHWIYAPELRDFSPRGDGMFKVEDAGGAFPAGSLRFDVFYENADEGFEFYSNSSRVRVGTSVYIDQKIPPAIEDESGQ